jgi:dihydrolipoamide dehydrogenase
MRTELAVIGGGPGGYAAAFLAADLGMEVTLVDPEPNPGGECLYRGCIPSKALLHAAEVIEEARQAAEWGVTFGEPDVDAGRLRAWKDQVVRKLTGGLGQLVKARGIRHLRGTARLTNAHAADVRTVEGTVELVFGHAIVATGSRAARLPLFPDSPRVMDSTAALEVPDVPPRLLVVGGGYIGLEMATVYAALGSRVTVVEATDGLLPGVDRDLVEPLARRLESHAEAVWLRTRVVKAHETAEGIEVVVDGAQRGEHTFDRVLVAVGRRPRSEGLGLERTRVEVGPDGFVVVDDQRRTPEPSISAIGDVTGEPMLAHKASHEGRAAVEALAGRAAAFDPRAIPAVVFTDPEIAWCGLTEAQAHAAGRPVSVARFPWAASGRALTLGRTDGVTKLIVDPGTGRILGAGLCGPRAGELIAELCLAVEMGARAADLAHTIHPHPTLSETLMEAAEVFAGEATHVFRPPRRDQ